jgi:hypothetical protein
MGDFLAAFQAGQRAKELREAHDERKIDNELQRKRLKLEMDRLKLEDEEHGRKLDMDRAKFLQGAPSSDLPKLPEPQVQVPEGGSVDSAILPGSQFDMAPAPVPIRGIPSAGIPSDQFTPQSGEDLSQAAQIKTIADGVRAREMERFKQSLKPVSEGAAVLGQDGQYTVPNPKPAPEPRAQSIEQQLVEAMKSGDKAAEQRIRSAMNARDQKPSTDGYSATVQRLIAAKAKGFEANPIVKKTQTMAEAVSFADGLNPKTTNPADDQALIYAFAKGMDPDSVVREGEYATVQKYAQSWADKFGFDAKRVFSNTAFLTPQARANMKTTIRAKYEAGRKQYDNVRKEYGRQIERVTKQPGGIDELVDFAAAFPTSGASAAAGGVKVLSIVPVKK